MDCTQLFRAEDGSLYVQAVRNCEENILVFETSGEFYTEAQHDTYTPTEKRIAEEVKIFGIVGYFSLGFASFLIVVTERLLQARLDGRAIWKISNIAVFPIRRNAMLSQDEEDLEAQYLCSLKNVLTCGNVFFSAELDLTNSCQRSKHRMRIPHTTPGEYLNGLDDRYFWNRELLSCFLDSPKTHFFLLPLISGFVGGKNIPKTSTKPELSFLLISRISRYRAGIKSRRKGVDALGHAAVEVESELIAMTVSEIASFVQVRGSVPFFWEEKVSEESTMRTNIEIGIAKSFQSMDAFETHLMRLSRIYGGTITILDLLDRSDSHVAILSDMYEKMTHKFMLADVMSIEYKNFHAVEQRHLLQQGNTLAFMFKQVVPYAIQNYVFPHLSPDSIFRLVHVGVTRQGYYLKSFESEKKQQQGVFRSNCLDCVDDTNTMQYQISWLALVNILQQTEIVDHAEASLLNKIQSLIAGLWVENGNAISLEYTGSGASSCYDVQPRIFSLIRRPLYKIQIDFSRLYLQLFQEAARQEDINVFMGVELKKSVKELRETALLKKKLRVRDLHQHPSTALRIFFFLRSILAPSNIKNTVTGFTPAMGWLAAFILLKKLLSLSTTEMMQRSRSSMDMAQLSPLLSDPADKGGKQVFLQAKLLEIDTSTIPVQSTRKSTPKSAGFEDHSSAKTRHASFN